MMLKLLSILPWFLDDVIGFMGMLIILFKYYVPNMEK